MLPVKFQNIEETIYAGFWRRLGAFLVDALILSPSIFLIIYINNAGRLNYLYTLIPSHIFYIFYGVYCVKRWGGTPGKLICKIKIININGNPVGWKEAILRYIVDFIFSVISSIGMIIVILGMTDYQYTSMTFLERSKWMTNHMPFWYTLNEYLLQIWMWSEFIVLLLNKRKRALHDFIAGTVVIKKKFEKEAEQFSQADTNTAPPIKSLFEGLNRF